MKANKNFLPMQAGDVPATAANTDALNAWVGFKPDTAVTTGIANFVAWYLKHYDVKTPAVTASRGDA
jgi:UDP-glucuronate 4-epimerase